MKYNQDIESIAEVYESMRYEETPYDKQGKEDDLRRRMVYTVLKKYYTNPEAWYELLNLAFGIGEEELEDKLMPHLENQINDEIELEKATYEAQKEDHFDAQREELRKNPKF